MPKFPTVSCKFSCWECWFPSFLSRQNAMTFRSLDSGLAAAYIKPQQKQEMMQEKGSIAPWSTSLVGSYFSTHFSIHSSVGCPEPGRRHLGANVFGRAMDLIFGMVHEISIPTYGWLILAQCTTEKRRFPKSWEYLHSSKPLDHDLVLKQSWRPGDTPFEEPRKFQRVIRTFWISPVFHSLAPRPTGRFSMRLRHGGCRFATQQESYTP